MRFVSGPWTVPANSEGEVCFATYFDFEQTGQVPTWAKTDCAGGALNAYSGECFASNRNMLTQDPQSHHSIISVYTGASLPSDPAWGEWVCLNGPNAGTTCDPTRIGIQVYDQPLIAPEQLADLAGRCCKDRPQSARAII